MPRRDFSRLTVRVEPWMAEKIQAWAVEMGLSPGEFYRFALAVGAHRLYSQWGSMGELPQELVVSLRDLLSHLLGDAADVVG